MERQMTATELAQEYAAYLAAMDRMDRRLGEKFPRLSIQEYADMSDLLAARFGVLA
jgi:hypothetical protein